LPVGFHEILEADVGQVELDAKLAFEVGACKPNFGPGQRIKDLVLCCGLASRSVNSETGLNQIE